MDSTSQHPPVPGLGKAPKIRRILVISVIAVLVAAILGAFVFVTAVLNMFDGNTSPRRETNKWSELQDQQLLRTGLRKLDQRAELIWENIDALQKEIDVYEQRFNNLEVNDEGRRLMKDKWVLRYFKDRWGEPLPQDRIAKHCRVRLNELMLTVQEALAETEPMMEMGSYEISADTKREVERIEFDVSWAIEEYTAHRLLLGGLSAKGAKEGPTPPKNLKEAVKKQRQQDALKRFHYPQAKEPSDSKESTRKLPTNNKPIRPEHEPTALDSSSLLHDVERNQSGVDDHFGDITLGRDAVPVRDEPRRRTLPE
jgi:hypothetical protein